MTTCELCERKRGMGTDREEIIGPQVRVAIRRAGIDTRRLDRQRRRRLLGMLLVEHHRSCKFREPSAHLRQQVAHLEGHLRVHFVDRIGLCRLRGVERGSHGVTPSSCVSWASAVVPSRFNRSVSVARSARESPLIACSIASWCPANTLVMSALPCGRQVNDPGAAVGRVIGPRHQVTRFQPIDGGGHRPAGQIDAAAELPDRLRSLVQQRLENREVRQAHIERFDAAGGVARQGPVRLHEHQPRMDRRLVGSSLCHGLLVSSEI